ncbi:MAG TPA: ATP synthase F1 subunit delta [Kofleriaceae bacterium]
MPAGSLARRYAKAIFEIGSQSSSLDQIGSNLKSLAAAMKDSAELQTLLANPAIRRADRRKVIDALLTRVMATQAVKNLVYLLLDGERLYALPDISREVTHMIEAKAGRVSAEVTSAKPLDPAQLSQITAALEKLSGKKVDVVRKEDPSLLGGVVAKVGDTVYDGSLRTQLRAIREELTK